MVAVDGDVPIAEIYPKRIEAQVLVWDMLHVRESMIKKKLDIIG